MTVKKKASKLFDNHLLDEIGVPIENLVTDSRLVKPGDTFLAYAGEVTDGRKFIPQAIAAGANAVLWDPQNFSWDPEWHIPVLAINELRAKAGLIASYVYGSPSQKLWVVGITGTNGKTSCSHWYAQAMTNLGKKTAVLGTLGNGFSGELEIAENTTPEATVLQRSLAKFVEQGAQSVAMEVSSHGLVQGRLNGTTLAIAVLTNLSRDHLDYHRDMDSYAAAKARLFFWPELKYAVINMDDALGRDLVNRVGARNIEVIRYSAGNGMGAAELTADNIAVTSAGLSFDVNWLGGSQGLGRFADMPRTRIQTHILGAFNVSNLLAVIGVLMASGIKLSVAAQVICHLQPVAGRMQTVRPLAGAAATPLVVVDYAHTPDALEKALATIATIVPDKGRLISVFGCGGDRDRGKRPLMGTISAQYADFTIVTSDNPRTENPQQILLEIAQGVGQAPHKLMDDRKLAIFDAINMAGIHDVVLIAGKGHEEYQILGSTKIHFSDVEVAAVALANWQGGAI